MIRQFKTSIALSTALSTALSASLACLGAGTAWAQPATTASKVSKAASKKAIKKTKKAAQAIAASKPVQTSPASSLTSAPLAGSAGAKLGSSTSTASVAKAGKNSVQNSGKTPSSRFRLNLSADYFGQAVTDLGTLNAPDVDTGTRSADSVVIDYGANLGFMLNPNWRVSTVVALEHTPAASARTDAYLLDPQIRLTNGNLYKRGGFSFGSELRTYLGLSDASQLNHLVTNLRWMQFLNYNMSTRWSLSLTTHVRSFIYSEITPGKSQLFNVYAGPQLAYSFNDNTQAWLLFEYQGVHRQGQPGRVSLTTVFTDLEPGMSFTLNPKLSFSPYLKIATSNRVALDTTTINANLTYRAL